MVLPLCWGLVPLGLLCRAAGRGGTGTVSGVDARCQVRVTGPLQGGGRLGALGLRPHVAGRVGPVKGTRPGPRRGARGDGEVASEPAAAAASDRRVPSRRFTPSSWMPVMCSRCLAPLGSPIFTHCPDTGLEALPVRPCCKDPLGACVSLLCRPLGLYNIKAWAPWCLRHDPERVLPRAAPPPVSWALGLWLTSPRPCLCRTHERPRCPGLRRAAWPLLAGPFRTWVGSLPLALLHLPTPQPQWGACAASGLSGGTGEELTFVGVGSLACALGPGGSEAPGKPAKAGLEQRPAGRCGASRGLGHGSGLSKTEPKIQTL